MYTFAEPLHRAERCFSDRIAIVDGPLRLQFSELVDRCRRLAGFVSTLTAPGDRVAVLAPNSHRVLELYYAVPASGRVIVPINTRHANPEIDYALADSGARLLFTDRDPATLGSAAERVDRAIVLGDAYERDLATSDPVPLGEGVEPEDLAGLFYTGGTTGASKGVMLSHRNKLADALHLETSVRVVEDDVWLILSPMFHAAGTFQALLCTWLGAAQVVLRDIDASSVLDAIAREGVTVTFSVPTVLSDLAEEQARHPRDVSSLRLLGYGAAPASSALIERVCERFPGTEIVSMYGATELGPMGTTLERMDRFVGRERIRSAGRGLAGVELRIANGAGSPLPPREIGEVLARGPNVMQGYWNKPEQTAAALVDGWYHTGDVGYLDEDGCLYLVDRLKDMIVSGGENVYSTEVEEVLYRHAAVAECAVFGVPHAHWGEAVHAVVVPRSGERITEAELFDHCRASLADYKVPKQIELRTEPLPKSAAGKILKREVRAPFWKGEDRAIHG